MVRENTVLSPVRARQPARPSPLSPAPRGTPAAFAAKNCPMRSVRHGNALRLLWRVTFHQLVHCRYVDAGYRSVSQMFILLQTENLWILYIDRQGCIQSRGFNFIKDLPTFFVLLLALQRLDLIGWGLNPTLDARVYLRASGPVGLQRRTRPYARTEGVADPN